MQAGNIRQSHGSWFLRYYATELVNGQPARVRRTKLLARVSREYPTAKSCKTKADEILATVNSGASAPEGSLTISAFTDGFFLPFITSKREPSTAKFYSDLFDNHLRSRIGELRLDSFQTRHAQEVLDDIQLSHQSLLRIKTGMSAIFSYAIRLGFLNGANPVREAKAEGSRSKQEQYAYNLNEVFLMLRKLSGVARIAVGVAAFSGLRKAEIRGLQWQDYTGDFLHVRRKVWNTHTGQTKTVESKNAVPVIPALRKLLDEHKATANGAVWIFTGPKKGFALHLDNLCRREILPVLGNKWHGWQSFRSGLATNLFEAGVPPEVVQTILRHADAATTRKHYILLKSKKHGDAAMRKLEKAVSAGAKRAESAENRAQAGRSNKSKTQ